MIEDDESYPQYTPLLNDDRIINEKFLRQMKTIREEAMKREESQKTTEHGKLPQSKGRNNIGRRRNSKEINHKRAQSVLVSNGKKMNKGRPSR